MSKSDRAVNSLESIYSAIVNVDNVEQVIIYENDTNEIDELGVQPHSFLALIDGGLSVEIAEAIWKNRPTGITSQGNTAVNILDIQGFTRTVNFSRPTPVYIAIEINLETDANFPADGEAQIKQALIDYVNTLKIGQDVVYSRLYTPINQVKGHQINHLAIGVGIPGGSANIQIEFDQVAELTLANITFV